LLVWQRCRRHLATCHSVDGIVDEDYGDILATVEEVDRFRGANHREVSVSVIADYHTIRLGSLDSGGYRRCSAVSSIDQVHISCIVPAQVDFVGQVPGPKGATPHRPDEGGVRGDGEFLYQFRKNPVDRVVVASGTIVRRQIAQKTWFGGNLLVDSIFRQFFQFDLVYPRIQWDSGSMLSVGNNGIRRDFLHGSGFAHIIQTNPANMICNFSHLRQYAPDS
tara:strand:+ start:2169 stop:2831 length:663 start_codon:yes stop_codon:yes gene_type:complete